jgi:hypothetical protein
MAPDLKPISLRERLVQVRLNSMVPLRNLPILETG